MGASTYTMTAYKTDGTSEVVAKDVKTGSTGRIPPSADKKAREVRAREDVKSVAINVAWGWWRSYCESGAVIEGYESRRVA